MATSKSKALKKAVNSIIDDIRSDDSKRQFRGTSKVSKLLRAPQRELEWESDQVIEAVVKTGAVARLASFLERYDDHKLQSEAANALANISAGTSQNTCAVINAGAVPIATRLLASASSDLQDHAAWLLANIACESCSCVLDAGALPPLLKLLDEQRQDTPSEISLVKTGTWLLSNLCQYTEDFEKVKDCLPRLAVLLKSNEEAVLKDACWGLMYMCRLNIDAVVLSGACEPLAKLLMHSSDDVCCVALEALSAIFTNGTTSHKEQIAKYNVFPRLRYLLHGKRQRTREITCSTLSNLIRQTPKLLPDLIESGVMNSLLKIIGGTVSTREGWLTWREAVRTAGYIVVSAGIRTPDVEPTPDVVKHLVGHGLLMNLNDTAGQAAYRSLELCIDPTLRLVEQLVEAGEAQQFDAQAVDGGEADAGSPTVTNSYKSYITDSGLAKLLSRASLTQIWQSGYDNNTTGASPPLPEHIDRLCSRVESLLRRPKPAKAPTLKDAAIKALRRACSYENIHELDIPLKDKATIIGLLPHQTNFVPPPEVTKCIIEETLGIKEVGDRNFICGMYEDAAAAYSSALATIQPAGIEALTLILLLNRSAAYMKLDKFEKVCQDCSQGLEISENHTQCLQRRAIAHERSGRLQAAFDDYSRLRGEDVEDARKKLQNQLGLTQPSSIMPARINSPGKIACNTDGRNSDDGSHDVDATTVSNLAPVTGTHSDDYMDAIDENDAENTFSFCSFRLLREITQDYLVKEPYM